MVHEVVVLALEGVVAFDLGIPAQIFGAAWSAAGEPLYAVRTATVDGGPVRTTGGFACVPEHDASILPTADTVVIPGIRTYGPLRPTGPRLTPSERAALATVTAGTRLVSICTAAFALADLGLLDGRPATTHWAYTDEFSSMFPLVKLDPSVLFVDDGDLLTSAGVAAGVDLCLHVVRRDFGSEVANGSARRSVVAPWRDGGQAQFIPQAVPPLADTTTGPARSWALERLHEPLDLATMATQARMSVRTFTRRFRDETGLSPSQWLVQQRLAQARLLLESTDLGVDAIAHRCGFGTAVSLRTHLHGAVGLAPLAYRRAFRPSS